MTALWRTAICSSTPLVKPRTHTARPDSTEWSRTVAPMPTDAELVRFMHVIGQNDEKTAVRMLTAEPELATVQLGQDSKKASGVEFFLAERLLQVYAGD